MPTPAKDLHLSLEQPSGSNLAPPPISPGCPTADWEKTVFRELMDKPRKRSCSTTDSLLDAGVTQRKLGPSGSGRLESGTYIAFSLFTPSLALEYPPAADSLAEHGTRRFVGLVTDSFTHSIGEKGFYEEIVVLYASPASAPLPSTDAPSIAISPTLSNAPCSPSSTDATPLRTGTLFPWAGHRQWLTRGTRLEVLHLHDSDLTFSLENDEHDRFEQLRAAAEASDAKEEEADADDFWTSGSETPFAVPEHAFPAEVWRNVREAGAQADGLAFPEEIQAVERLLQDCRADLSGAESDAEYDEHADVRTLNGRK
ncbi:hypothetical protein OF83DRAFT_1171827 [Amylostereum chailletii]|nr:hypothetical protein OF83DRAFT_1171827 [Amylostereum chailletii]